ncbi:hypothetical protein GQ55_1G171700 [Panicum hallii var. hallii]|jgi:hypothetical protein|uniref:Reverse transcriptase/retrotransposon-derived protein RNase H-like domain-containing protein n=1 Tax=Panicum hallii var. hallii TaxID=1504633 RepID=A0A2T7F5V7_9POAL|nr:hypothetical protein GQ55_1G171700 [Panicum hallii var. hallii]
MCIAGYYGKFVRDFGVIGKPLTTLLKKGVQFLWTAAQEEAFVALKHAFSSTPILALPNFQKTFTIEIDVSDKGIGAVLLQDQHPIAYVSRALGPRNQALSTYEKECLAILLVVEHWRSYLQHAEFIIQTGQKSLVHLDDQRLSTPWQHKALTKLMGLQYKLCYKKGTENKAADALSRIHPQHKPEVLAISSAQPIWLQELIQSYVKFPDIARLLASLSVKSTMGEYMLHDGLIKFKGKILVLPNEKLQQTIIQSLHSTAIGGHSGPFVTYQKVKQMFF